MNKVCRYLKICQTNSKQSFAHKRARIYWENAPIHLPHLSRTRCVPTMRHILQSSRALTLVCFSMSHSSAAYLSMFWRIFGGRTGEAGKRQPDNFQGLKAGRWVKDFLSGIFHHISICLFPVGHISQAEGSQQKRLDCGWPAGVLWRSLPRCSQQ